MKDRLYAFMHKYVGNNTCQASITCSKDIIDAVCETSLICEEQIQSKEPMILHPVLLPAKEGFLTSSGVQFIALGVDFSYCKVPPFGVLEAFEKILSLNYLWKKVRVEGGAYGSGAHISRSKHMILWSYRDPHISKTLNAYKGAADYFKNLELSRDELERIIIGCFSRLDMPLNPQQIGQMSDNLYFRKISQTQLQAEREQLLSTTIADLQSCSLIMEQAAVSSAYCVVGNADALHQNRGLFNRLQQI
jgi:Zn-dependent M16 (insulinase) family peptidase